MHSQNHARRGTFWVSKTKDRHTTPKDRHTTHQKLDSEIEMDTPLGTCQLNPPGVQEPAAVAAGRVTRGVVGEVSDRSAARARLKEQNQQQKQ